MEKEIQMKVSDNLEVSVNANKELRLSLVEKLLNQK